MLKDAEYNTRIQLWNVQFNKIVQSSTVYSTNLQIDNLEGARRNLEELSKSLDQAAIEISAARRAIPFGFLDDYDEFIILMREYVTKQRALLDKYESGRTLTETEVFASLKPFEEAFELFETDGSGYYYVANEKDQLEVWEGDYLAEPFDRAEEAFNKAEVYYDDANLLYEQLVRGTPTGQVSANITA